MSLTVSKPHAFEAHIRIFFSSDGCCSGEYFEDVELPEGSPTRVWCPMHLSLESSETTLSSSLWEYAVTGLPVEVNSDGLLAYEFTCRLCGSLQTVHNIGSHLFEHGHPFRRIILEIGINPYASHELLAAISMVDQDALDSTTTSPAVPRKHFWIPLRLILSKYFRLSSFGALNNMLSSDVVSVLEKFVSKDELNHIFHANHASPKQS